MILICLLKEKLGISFVEPLREKRKYFEKNIGEVHNIIEKGGKIAREHAEEKMVEIREKIGVTI